MTYRIAIFIEKSRVSVIDCEHVYSYVNKGSACSNSLISRPLQNRQTVPVCINEMHMVIETVLTGFLKFLLRHLKGPYFPEKGQGGKVFLIMLFYFDFFFIVLYFSLYLIIFSISIHPCYFYQHEVRLFTILFPVKYCLVKPLDDLDAGKKCPHFF